VTPAQGPDAGTTPRAASATQPLRATGTPPGGSQRPVSAAAGTSGGSSAGSAGPRRPVPRPSAPRADEGSARTTAKARRARLALKRIDPWSVFVFSLIAALLLGIALVAAVAALYAVLDGLGVQSSVNQLFAEVVGEGSGPLITGRRVVGGAAVLAALNVVLLTLLATLGALLYNLCASFTGGLELTLGERDG
jgi:hypothetical protein